MNYQDPSIGVERESATYVTITRDDPDFRQYLLGRSPRGLLAVPVESFSINTRRERVTFRLTVPMQHKSWSQVKALGRLLRLETLPLTWAPLAVVVAAVTAISATPNYWPVLWMWLSLTGLHVAAFALNDYGDHIHGLDRIQPRRGSQVIQQGLISAAKVRWWAAGGLAFALFAAVPLVFEQPVVMILFGLLGLGAVVGYNFYGRGFKHQGVGDLVVALCLGPLMALGVAQILVPEKSLALMLLGLPLGLSAMMVFQFRQLETFMAERSARTGTWVARLGFDAAKKWLGRGLMLMPAVIMISLWPWLGRTHVMTLALVLVVIQLPLQWKMRKSISPLSSHLVGLSRFGRWYALILIVSEIVALRLSL